MARKVDPKRQRTPSPRSRALQQGFEPGSVMDRMTPAGRKAVTAWLKEKERDNRALEKQLMASTRG